MLSSMFDVVGCSELEHSPTHDRSALLVKWPPRSSCEGRAHEQTTCRLPEILLPVMWVAQTQQFFLRIYTPGHLLLAHERLPVICAILCRKFSFEWFLLS